MNKLWIAGVLACLSVVAVAQSDQSKDKAPAQGQTANPPDAATGQAAGKRMHKPVSATDASSSQATPVAKGGKTANDDWTTSAKTNDPKGKGQSPVVAGDVNGDGVADATAKNSGHATEAKTATGQATGKRQHEPVTATKQPDTKSTQK